MSFLTIELVGGPLDGIQNHEVEKIAPYYDIVQEWPDGTTTTSRYRFCGNIIWSGMEARFVYLYRGANARVD